MIVYKTKIDDDVIEIIPYKEYVALREAAAVTERRREKDRERKKLKYHESKSN